MKLSTQQKTTMQFAGLTSLATALVSVSLNQMLNIKLNFWMLFALLLAGIGTFVYIDLRNRK